jgi:cytochrome c oxidase subunit 4
MTNATRGHEAHAKAPGHVVPLRLLVGVLGALLVLTVVTVAVTYVDLGPLNLVVALLIAVIKASLVLLVFMHLLWDRPFNAVVLIVSLATVMIFVMITLLDAYHYQPEMIPGYAPELYQTPQ